MDIASIFCLQVSVRFYCLAERFDDHASSEIFSYGIAADLPQVNSFLMAFTPI